MVNPSEYGLPNASEWRMMRAKLDLSQEQVADRAGLSSPSVSKLEQGNADVRMETVRKTLNVYRDAWENDDD